MASSVATPLERQFGRIAGLTELTSTSSLGATSIVLQFDLDRNIDAAARDVQAAINAARSQLPANLPSNPTYKKVNPADAPILILALTSQTLRRGLIYDAADSILAQKLSQIQGVGQVSVGGSALPGVRVELNLPQLNNYGIGLEQVRSVLASANANIPKGELADQNSSWALGTTDQLLSADQYRPLIVAYNNGAAVRLSDIADVTDSVEDVRNAGMVDGVASVMIIIFRQPGANIIDTVDRVMAALPQLQASISQAIKMSVVLDRTTTIRASVRDVELTLVISILLVILVVYGRPLVALRPGALHRSRRLRRDAARRGWFRLTPGGEVRLRHACIIKCVRVVKNEQGELAELRCTWDPESRGGNPKDGRKIKGTLHWVAEGHAVPAEVRLYDCLFRVERPGQGAGEAVGGAAGGPSSDSAEGADKSTEVDRDFLADINPDSLTIERGALVEPSLAAATVGERVQFERVGYFCVDPESRPGALVFNRTIGLRDSWAAKQGR